MAHVETVPQAVQARGRVAEAAIDGRRNQPVQIWAALGALILAFIVYVLVSWVTGPYFKNVPSGPSEPGDVMKAAQIIFMGVMAVAMVFMVYKVAYLPWRRERRMTTDGLLCFAALTMYIQDPITNLFGYWFTYNSWTPNMGSWLPEIPGFASMGAPGAVLPEPVFMMFPGYIYFFVGSMFLGLALIRRLKRRYPNISSLRLMAAVYVLMFFFDIAIEVGVWLPLGFYAYTWAPGPMLFEGTWHQFPLIESVLVGFLLTSVVALRYFTDDKGLTFVERGVENVRTTPRRRTLLRFLALVAAMNTIYFLTYNIWGIAIGANTKDWPADTQQRSYFLDGVCGEHTRVACPTEATPNVRGNSAAVDPQGRLYVPAGVELPKPVPLDRGEPGP